MNPLNYQIEALRTNDPEAYTRTLQRIQTDPALLQLLLGGMGLASEAGEASDVIKKHIFHGAPLDAEKLKKEIGDVLWYMNLILCELGSTFEEVMQLNVDKLKARYPDGFSEKAANATRTIDEEVFVACDQGHYGLTVKNGQVVK